MSDYSSFGSRIKKYRQSLSLSQEAFCNGLCSLRQYRRIEADESDISLYLLDRFSYRYNHDFVSEYRTYSHHTEGDYFLITKLNDALGAKDYSVLNNLVNTIEPNLATASDEIKINYYYALALIHKEEKEALDYVFWGLSIETGKEVNKSTLNDIHVFSNTGLCLLNLAAMIYKATGEDDSCLSILKKLYNQIYKNLNDEQFYYQSHDFIYELYSKVTINYCLLLMKHNSTRTALTLLDRTVNLITKHNHSNNLHALLWVKVRLQYDLNMIDDANATLSEYFTVCSVFKKNAHASRTRIRITNDYPLLINK